MMDEVDKFYRSLTDTQRHEMHERLNEIKRALSSKPHLNFVPMEALMLAYQAGQESVKTPRVYFHVGDIVKTSPSTDIPAVRSDNEAVLPRGPLYIQMLGRANRCVPPRDPAKPVVTDVEVNLGNFSSIVRDMSDKEIDELLAGLRARIQLIGGRREGKTLARATIQALELELERRNRGTDASCDSCSNFNKACQLGPVLEDECRETGLSKHSSKG